MRDCLGQQALVLISFRTSLSVFGVCTQMESKRFCSCGRHS